jgi:hypothetical protein
MDDYSRYMWVATIPSKDRAAAEIKGIQARAESEAGVKLRVLRTDRGGESSIPKNSSSTVQVMASSGN